MEGKPWLFDSSLLSLKAIDGCTLPLKMDFSKKKLWIQLYNLPLGCMNADVGMQIGKSIGTVVKCDIDEDGIAWGKVIHVCIELDLQHTITQGRTINIKGNRLWVPLTYEKLPRVCFRCKKLIHD